MRIHETELPGVIYASELPVYPDNRGYFLEVARESQIIQDLGVPDFSWKQVNFAKSFKNVLRGLHAEPWRKYIRMLEGRGIATILDLRKSSPSFGRYEMFELVPTTALFLRVGLANSYLAIEETRYCYVVDQEFPNPKPQFTMVNAHDPNLQIPWPIERGMQILSAADLGHPNLKDVPAHMLFA
jgi:dTDP-4-dehydrorhamnose 3,5-epimerase-like enzyme